MDPIVVMGVAGCGKSSLAQALAAALGLPLVEGDDHHPAANVARMRAGIALTDADRAGWLDALAAQLQAHPQGLVMTCSALKRSYRERLRAAAPGLRFVHLALGREEARRRVAQRAGSHYFHPGLVDSQFDALEPPAGERGVLTLPATDAPPRLRDAALAWLAGAAPQQPGPAPQETRP